jgi:hypothetical protein
MRACAGAEGEWPNKSSPGVQHLMLLLHPQISSLRLPTCFYGQPLHRAVANCIVYTAMLHVVQHHQLLQDAALTVKVLPKSAAM